MEEQARHRRIRRELFNDFKDTAVGMMENFQENSSALEQRFARFAEELERELNARKK